MRRILTAAFLSLACSSVAPAADWLELKDFQPLTQRVSVTIENPADAPVPAALVHLRMQDLHKVLPDAKAGHVCVVEPGTKEAKRDAADLNFVPSQENQGNLIFSLPLKPHEKKQVYIYTSTEKLNLPGFPSLTAYDSRHAYRSFENKYCAFRCETGPGANTSGMVVDAFGKTKQGQGLRLVEIYGTGHDSYHKLSYWGVDILKVGSSPGIGGLYLYVDGKEGRPLYATTIATCRYQGPVETKIELVGPVEVSGRKFTVTRTLTLVGEDRSILDEVQVKGDKIDDVQLGLGLRDLPNCVWVEHPDKGYCFQTGDHNQPTYKAVGLGCTFDPAEYVKTVDLPDKENGGHVYVLKGKLDNNTLTSKHRLAVIWDMDAQLPAPVDTAEQLRAPFDQWHQAWSTSDQNPIKVTIAESPESH